MKFKEKIKDEFSKKFLSLVSIFYTIGLLLSLGSFLIVNFAIEERGCYYDEPGIYHIYCKNFTLEGFINYLDSVGFIFFAIFFYLSPIILFGSLFLLLINYKDKNLKYFFSKPYFYSFFLSLIICFWFLIEKLENYLLDKFILS